MKNARRNRRRSTGVKKRKRRTLDIVNDVDEVVFGEVLKKGNKVLFAAFGVYAVLFKERIANLTHRPRRLNELPDSCADGIKPVVDAVFEVEDCRFVPKICGGLLF